MSVMESLKKALLKQREQEKDKPAASEGQFVNKGLIQGEGFRQEQNDWTILSTANPLLSPPPLFRGRKLISPPIY